MQNPSIKDSCVLRCKVFNTWIIRPNKNIFRKLRKHVQNVRTSPWPCVPRPIEDTIELDRVFFPSFSYCAYVFVKAGYHSYMARPWFSRHLSIRDCVIRILISFFALSTWINLKKSLFFMTRLGRTFYSSICFKK